MYGIQKNQYVVESQLTDDGCSVGVVTQRIENISREKLDQLEYFYQMPDHEDEDAGKDVHLEVLRCVGKDNKKYGVEFRTLRTTDRACEGTFVFNPVIGPGEYVDLTFKRKSPPKTFRMFVDQNQRDYREHSGITVSYPMDRLVIIVVFPSKRHFPLVCDFTVYYGRTRSLQHYREEERLRGEGISVTSNLSQQGVCALTLDVKYPILGLNYIVWWNPPVHSLIVK